MSNDLPHQWPRGHSTVTLILDEPLPPSGISAPGSVSDELCSPVVLWFRPLGFYYDFEAVAAEPDPVAVPVPER